MFFGCASSKIENTKNNEVGYYYYEVKNKTDKTHTVHSYVTLDIEHKQFYEKEENIVFETDVVFIEPGESYVFKYPVYSECFITPICAGLNFCPFAEQIIIYGWEATCIP